MANRRMPNYKYAATFLRRLRQDKGLTQRRAAASLGILQACLSRYERGVDKPKPRVMRALAALYSDDPDRILYQLVQLYARGEMEVLSLVVAE